MKTSSKKILIIELTMIFFLSLNFFISNVFSPYIFVAFLAIIYMISRLLLGFEKNDNVYRKSALKSILIVVMSYFLVIYLVGLIVGFTWSIYNIFSTTHLVKNIIPFLLIVFFSESIRFIFINKSNKNKYLTILSAFVFILFTASYYFKIYDLNVYNELFQYIGIMIIGNIALNIFLTIQCINAGYKNNIIYRLIMEGYVYIVPFTPKLGPYVTAVLSVLIPSLCAFMVYKRKFSLEKASKKKRKNTLTRIIILIFILVVMSNSGFFKYQNMTIGSNSMKPYMSKGDIIILEKLKGEELNELKKNDILVFRYGKKVIAHRIKNIYDDGIEKRFRTKGDANETYDEAIIQESQVIGILKYRIRYIGLPSIWVRELFE